MSKHTPEPWEQKEDWVKKGDEQVALVYGINDSQEHANAARIVACVNACDGIEQPEQFVSNALQNAVRMLELQAERDELLAALEDIAQLHPKDHAGRENCFAIARKKALETLAKVKGGQS